MQIIPAILENNFEEIKIKMAQVNGVVDTVQIDLCDGLFVESKTWPFWSRQEYEFKKLGSEEIAMPFWDTLDVEWDLMIKMPEHYIKDLVHIGAKRIIIHALSVTDPMLFLEKLDSYTRSSIEWGIAILPDVSNVDIYRQAISQYDFVQVMGIEKIGVQGSSLSSAVFDVIKKIKSEFPDKVISVDGGVSLKNGQDLFDCGVTRVVAGSAIFKSVDIERSIKQFEMIQ